MSRKMKRTIIGIVALALIAACIAIAVFALGSKSSEPVKDASEEQISQQEEQPSEQTDPQADTEKQVDIDEATSADWMSKANDDTLKIVNMLCMSDWSTTTGTYLVSFDFNGTYKSVKDGEEETTGTWSLSDVKADSSNESNSSGSSSGVIVIDGESYAFTSATQTINANQAENMSAIKSFTSRGIAAGGALTAKEKDRAFTVLRATDELKSYIPDFASFEKQMQQFARDNVPIATTAMWNKDMKIDYEKKTATTTFTCNNSKQTVITAKIPLEAGIITLSTSTNA